MRIPITKVYDDSSRMLHLHWQVQPKWRKIWIFFNTFNIFKLKLLGYFFFTKHLTLESADLSFISSWFVAKLWHNYVPDPGGLLAAETVLPDSSVCTCTQAFFCQCRVKCRDKGPPLKYLVLACGIHSPTLQLFVVNLIRFGNKAKFSAWSWTTIVVWPVRWWYSVGNNRVRNMM